jgi:hypothetical protein
MRRPNVGTEHLKLRSDLEQLAVEVRRRLVDCQALGLDAVSLGRLEEATNEICRVAYAVEHGHWPCCMEPEHGGEMDRHLAEQHRQDWHAFARRFGGYPECPLCRANER